MENKRRYGIWDILLTALWSLIGVGTIVLLMAAIQKKDAKQCRGIAITIKGVSNNFFVDKADILNTITAIAKGDPVGQPIGSFNLEIMETTLEKSTWVKAAELFFDNNDQLQVDVLEREPIARVFTTSGSSFYIDNDVTMLPLSDKFSARLPVFTNFPSHPGLVSRDDSNLLAGIKLLSLAIQSTPFRMAMIEQVDITPQRAFEMIPKIGNQLILLGDASDLESKFQRLELFYKEVMVKAGWNTYSVINLQYKGQVVAKRRGSEDIAADSLRTLQIMQWIAANAEKHAGDSLQLLLPDNDRNNTDSSMIQQSIQRDDNNNESPNTIEKPQPQGQVISIPAPTPMAPVVNTGTPKKPAVKISTSRKPTTVTPKSKPLKPTTQQPKIVMPKKNEY